MTMNSSIAKFGGAALLALLVLGTAAAPAVAQDMEQTIRAKALQVLSEAQSQPAPALALGQGSGIRRVAAATTGGMKCLPTCDITDSRFLAIASTGFGTLSPPELSLAVSVPVGTTSFTIGFFDGDARDTAQPVQNWDSGLTSLFDYTLYADPDADGSGLTVIEMLPGQPAILSTAMANNAWTDFTVNTGPEAATPSGNFFYILKIRMLTSVLTLNSFKVRTSAVLSGLTLDPVARPFSYVALWTSMTDLLTVYPSFPSASPTTYDGTFNFYFDVPVSQDELPIWDGDFDFGKFDGSVKDTDDPNTPGAPFLPDWYTSDTRYEGVATGSNPTTTGNPSDDDNIAAPFGSLIVREPSAHYHILAPDGQLYENDNPSGNLEWEQFNVSTAPYDPALMDKSTSSLPPGTYQMQIRGVDMLNLNALLPPFRLLCVDELGGPCILLRPYLVGERVFFDQDGDGSQGSGEAGAPGVALGLYDSHGALIATATTDASGHYTFGVESETYEVRVEASNFLPGGPLEGYATTTGGDSRTGTVPKGNLLTFNFGYRGTASLGDRVWNDADGDGTVGSGETGLDGVTVELLDGSGGVAATAVTSGGGYYSFPHLGPGSYTVRVVSSTVPAGMDPTYDADGTTTPYTAAVSVAPGAAVNSVDFGFRKLVTIGDRVWNDWDGDGVQDAGEPGLNGLTVQLVNSSSTVVATAVTSGDGNYSFPGVAAGTYTVRVVPPACMAPTYDVDGTATPNAATVAATDNLSGVDFGYRTTARPGTGTIGYWKNHAAAWPVQQITVGGVTYSKAQAISLMGTPGKGDKTYDLFKQLVAAMLNVIAGNEPGCIQATIDAANAWMATYPPGSNVKSNSAPWSVGGPLHEKLDDYNNGELCAPHRD